MPLKIFKVTCFLFIFLCSCSRSTSLVKMKSNNCLYLIDKLDLEDDSTKSQWLISHSEYCSKINDFLNEFNYSQDSKMYMLRFLKMKMEDDDYRLERFVELYCLLHNNPDALLKNPVLND